MARSASARRRGILMVVTIALSASLAQAAPTTRPVAATQPDPRPLEEAVRLANLDPEKGLPVVARLIDAGAPVNPPGPGRMGALHWARHPEVAEFLIARGALVNPPDENAAEVAEGEQPRGALSPLHALASGQRGFQGEPPPPMAQLIATGEVLLAAGADLNRPNGNGRTPLHVAAEFGTVEMIEWLFAKGADVNPKGWRAPVVLASHREDTLEPARALIRAGAKPTFPVVLKLGLAGALREMLADDPLLAAGDDRMGGSPAVERAIAGGSIECLRLLLEHAADPNDLSPEGDVWDEQPLHKAARRGDAGMVRLLIAYGANATASHKGVKPVDVATDPAVRELLSKPDAVPPQRPQKRFIEMAGDARRKPPTFASADEARRAVAADPQLVHRVFKDGETALHAAMADPRPEVVRVLIEAGADVHQRTRGTGREQPLHALVRAAYAVHVRRAGIGERRPNDPMPSDEAVAEVATMLLARGADPNAAAGEEDYPDAPPLNRAAGSGNVPLVRALLKAGADVNHVSHQQRTALHAAARNLQRETVMRLIQQTGLNAPKDLGDLVLVVLMNESRKGEVPGERLKLVRELLDAGAPVNHPDDTGAALVSAATNGHDDVIDLLQSRGGKVRVPPAATRPASPEEDPGRYISSLAMVDKPDTARRLVRVGVPLDVSAAAAYGYADRVREIIKDDPDAVNGVPTASPLMFAARGGHTEIVRLLLDAGANVNPKVDRGGWIGAAPLESAAIRGKIDVMKLLIERGADVNVRDDRGQTLLARLEDLSDRRKPGPEVSDLLKAHGAVK